MNEAVPAAGMSQIDVRELGQFLRRRRAAKGLSLRQVEAALDHALTASTLSRLENGATPDPTNVALLAAWLEIPLELVTWPGESTQNAQLDTPRLVEIHLRADKNLKPEAAEVLAMLFRRLYQDIVSGEVPLSSPSKAPDE